MAESGKQYVTAADIKARAGKRKVEEVEAFGGFVRVSAMSSHARDRFEQSLMVEGPNGKQQRDMKNFRAKLLAATLVDENGALMFNEGEVTQLGQIDAGEVERIVNVALRLNGFSDDDVKEIAKN